MEVRNFMGLENKSNKSVTNILSSECFKSVENYEIARQEQLEKIRQALAKFSDDFVGKISNLYAEKPNLVYTIKIIEKLKKTAQFSEDEILNIIPVFFTGEGRNPSNIKAFEAWILSTEAKDKALFVVQQLIDRGLIEKVDFDEITSFIKKDNDTAIIKAYLDFIQITVDYPKITASPNKSNQMSGASHFRNQTGKSDYETLKQTLFSEAADAVKRVATLKDLLQKGYSGTLSAAGYNLKLINEILLKLEENTDESPLESYIQFIQTDHQRAKFNEFLKLSDTLSKANQIRFDRCIESLKSLNFSQDEILALFKSIFATRTGRLDLNGSISEIEVLTDLLGLGVEDTASKLENIRSIHAAGLLILGFDLAKAKRALDIMYAATRWNESITDKKPDQKQLRAICEQAIEFADSMAVLQALLAIEAVGINTQLSKQELQPYLSTFPVETARLIATLTSAYNGIIKKELLFECLRVAKEAYTDKKSDLKLDTIVYSSLWKEKYKTFSEDNKQLIEPLITKLKGFGYSDSEIDTFLFLLLDNVEMQADVYLKRLKLTVSVIDKCRDKRALTFIQTLKGESGDQFDEIMRVMMTSFNADKALEVMAFNSTALLVADKKSLLPLILKAQRPEEANAIFEILNKHNLVASTALFKAILKQDETKRKQIVEGIDSFFKRKLELPKPINTEVSDLILLSADIANASQQVLALQKLDQRFSDSKNLVLDILSKHSGDRESVLEEIQKFKAMAGEGEINAILDKTNPLERIKAFLELSTLNETLKEQYLDVVLNAHQPDVAAKIVTDLSKQEDINDQGALKCISLILDKKQVAEREQAKLAFIKLKYYSIAYELIGCALNLSESVLNEVLQVTPELCSDKQISAGMFEKMLSAESPIQFKNKLMQLKEKNLLDFVSTHALYRNLDWNKGKDEFLAEIALLQTLQSSVSATLFACVCASAKPIDAANILIKLNQQGLIKKGFWTRVVNTNDLKVFEYIAAGKTADEMDNRSTNFQSIRQKYLLDFNNPSHSLNLAWALTSNNGKNRLNSLIEDLDANKVIRKNFWTGKIKDQHQTAIKTILSAKDDSAITIRAGNLEAIVNEKLFDLLYKADLLDFILNASQADAKAHIAFLVDLREKGILKVRHGKGKSAWTENMKTTLLQKDKQAIYSLLASKHLIQDHALVKTILDVPVAVLKQLKLEELLQLDLLKTNWLTGKLKASSYQFITALLQSKNEEERQLAIAAYKIKGTLSSIERAELANLYAKATPVSPVLQGLPVSPTPPMNEATSLTPPLPATNGVVPPPPPPMNGTLPSAPPKGPPPAPSMRLFNNGGTPKPNATPEPSREEHLNAIRSVKGLSGLRSRPGGIKLT